MDDIVLLEWIYTPDSYFEDSFKRTDELCEIHISKGKIEARIDPSYYDNKHKIREILHKKIESIFLARQLHVHQSYTLSKSTMYKLYSDGRKDTTVLIEGVQAISSVGIVDVIIHDFDANVINKTRQERIDASNAFVELIAKYDNDPSLISLLKSYNLAVEYPENEFVYLFEIREVIDGFSRNTKVSTTDFFKISVDDWKRFNDLLNNQPLIQSRHRGQNALNLRSATAEELKEARSISKKFIEAYLQYLESQEV